MSSLAISISSGPTFLQAASAPLAGVLQVTTDVPSRVSVVVSNGTNVWERDFYNYAMSNSVPLFGFQPGQTNLIQVTTYDRYRNSSTARQLLTFVTPSLPVDFPELTVLTNDPGQMEPGYTLFTVQNRADSGAYITIVNSSGQVVWIRQVFQQTDIDVQQLADGNLFIHEQPPANQFLEVNLLGQIVQTWKPAAGYPINSHVGVVTDRGTILYLSDVSEIVTNFPIASYPLNEGGSTNPPLGTEMVDDNPVVEVSTNGALANVWSPLNQLDPTRVTYITGDFPSSFGLDSEHANAIIDDTNDNSIIVSQRDQNTIYKFSRNTGKLIWILAPNGPFAPQASWSTNLEPYVLTPTGTPFEWCYAQHAPELTPQGTLLVLDDGDDRATPFQPILPDQDNYSRAVEYNIDETNLTVSQVWDSYDSGLGGGDRLFTFIVGNADWQPQRRNVLATFGWVTYVNGVSVNTNGATMARIVEYTHEPVPQVVWDLSIWNYNGPQPANGGFLVYRSHRIPDLYAHIAAPVSNIVFTVQNQTSSLEFSADPTFTYEIQASSDLENWTTIGTAYEEDDAGDFDFDDLGAYQFAGRFYRVVTATQ
jgi:arylsulfate sulfotransferase